MNCSYISGRLGNLAIQYDQHEFNDKVIAVDINDDILTLTNEKGEDKPSNIFVPAPFSH